MKSKKTKQCCYCCPDCNIIIEKCLFCWEKEMKKKLRSK